jgi:CheY-like chemotaxis protein
MTTNILVVGKEAWNVELARDAVDEMDYQIIPAPSMSLALFLAQKNLPELILCGTELMDGDPQTFLKEVQADDELRQIPFMLLTANQVDEKDGKRWLTMGAALVLPTDISATELFSTIQPYIESRLARKEGRVVETSE